MKIQAIEFFALIFMVFVFRGQSASFSPSEILYQNFQAGKSVITWNEHRNKPSKDLKVGVAVYHSPMEINYNRNKKQVLHIEFKEPVMVYRAEESLGWGFVQFPRIFKILNENKIAVVWNLAADDITAQPKVGWKYSKDNGKTWFFRWSESPSDLGVELSDGERLKLISLKFKTDQFDADLSKALYYTYLNSDIKYDFYDKEKLPDSLKGFYLNRYSTESDLLQKEHAKVEETGTLQYATKGILPLQAWGNLKKAPDGSLITCQYPVYFKKDKNGIDLPSVGFYRSTDNGSSWKMISHIPFRANYRNEEYSKIDTIVGFTEPAFEFLSDGRMICVLRSSLGMQTAPMYMSVSKDLGKTWSQPELFTNNGVSPQLLKLENGVIVMSSGRPGVQVRFLDDEKEMIWTDPFEMIRYKDLSGQVSCGYTGLLATGKDSFLIVYSDFRSRDSDNNIRKAILVREVVVEKTKE